MAGISDMMKRALLAGAMSLAFTPALAQTTLTPPYVNWGGSQKLWPSPSALIGYDSGTGLPCVVGSTPTCLLATSGSGGGSGASSGGIGANPFTPNGVAVVQTVDSTGETFTIAAGTVASFVQTGAIKNVFCAPGGSASTTTSKDYPVAQDFIPYTGTTITCKTAGSDTSVVQIMPGTTAVNAALPLQAQSAEPAAATTGNPVPAWADLFGKLVTSPYAPRNLFISGAATSTDTAAHTLNGAAGGSIKNYITDLICTRSDAGTMAITITFSDVATTKIDVPNNGGGGGFSHTYNVPLVTAVNTAFAFTSGTSTTSVHCSDTGHTGL